MAQQSSPSEEIAALQRELKDLRHERRLVQRRVAEGAGLPQVIDRVRRDRSALSSPEADQAREQAQRLHDELDELWEGVDRIRQMAGRLARQGPHLADQSALRAVFAAEAATRGEIAEHLRAAGVQVRVPTVAGGGA